MLIYVDNFRYFQKNLILVDNKQSKEKFSTVYPHETIYLKCLKLNKLKMFFSVIQ